MEGMKKGRHRRQFVDEVRAELQADMVQLEGMSQKCTPEEFFGVLNGVVVRFSILVEEGSRSVVRSMLIFAS